MYEIMREFHPLRDPQFHPQQMSERRKDKLTHAGFRIDAAEN